MEEDISWLTLVQDAGRQLGQWVGFDIVVFPYTWLMMLHLASSPVGSLQELLTDLGPQPYSLRI